MAKHKTLSEIIEFSGRNEESFFNLVLNAYTFVLDKEIKKLKRENEFYTQTHLKNELMTKLGHQKIELDVLRRETRMAAIELFFGEIAESDLTQTAKKKAEVLHDQLMEEFTQQTKKDDNTPS